jgi:hypothetical protein
MGSRVHCTFRTGLTLDPDLDLALVNFKYLWIALGQAVASFGARPGTTGSLGGGRGNGVRCGIAEGQENLFGALRCVGLIQFFERLPKSGQAKVGLT